jgi:signal transduction histidine kinase
LNNEARKRLKLADEVIGQPVTAVLKQDSLINLFTADPPFPREVALSDGSVWLPRIAQIPNAGIILTLQDITELHELDAAKAQFLTALSHDLKEPLHQISNLVTELNEAGSLNREQAQLVRQMVQASEHMMSLLAGLLELAHLDSRLEPAQQPNNIWEIVTDVVHMLQPKATAKHIAIVLTAEPGQYQVLGDPGQLRRAVSSLIENAIKFSPTEQKIQVTLTARPDHVMIEVQDWGPGIAKSDLPHIFKKFYRGHVPDESGSGLGLTLAQSIAELHGGQLWAESKSSRGSIFYFELPLYQPILS